LAINLFIFIFLSYSLPFGKSLIKDRTTNSIVHFKQQDIILVQCCTISLDLKLIMKWSVECMIWEFEKKIWIFG